MQKVLNDRSNTVRFDLLSYARILHIMIHYELQNFHLLTALIEGVQRYIRERKQLKNPEILLLSMYEKLVPNPVKILLSTNRCYRRLMPYNNI